MYVLRTFSTFSREEAHLGIYGVNNDGIVDFQEFMAVFMRLTGRTRGLMKLIFTLNYRPTSTFSLVSCQRSFLETIFIIFKLDHSDFR